MASEEEEYMVGYTGRTKRSRACHICKKRKGRCEGGIPCRWCQAHNLKCSTIAEPDGGTKKKKRDDTRSTVLLNTRELGLLTDAEVGRYIDLYIKACMIDMTQGGAVVKHLQNPKTYSDFFIKYATCALSARATGDVTRASNIMNEARSFARQSYDDMSMESLAGFVMLSLYWSGIDVNVMKHYGAIGVSILETVPRDRVPTHLGYVSVIHKNMFASNASYEEKITALAAGITNITIGSASAAFAAGEMRILMKLLGQAPGFSLNSSRRSDLLAVMMCQLTFNDAQREAVVKEMHELIDIGGHCVNALPLFVIKYLEVFITWRSGNPSRAIELAVELSPMCTKENFMFSSRFEVEFLFSLAILTYETHPALATQFYSLAEHVCSLVCVTANLSQSSEHLASFIGELLPPEPQPIPQPKSRSSRTPSPPAAHTRMVDGLMALAHRFVPPTNTKALLSLEGLHTMHASLTRLCPPLRSRYNPLIHLPNHAYYPKLPSNVPLIASSSPSIPSPSAPVLIPSSTSVTSSPPMSYSPMVIQSPVFTSSNNQQYNMMANNYSTLSLHSASSLHNQYQSLAYQFNPVNQQEMMLEKSTSNLSTVSSNSPCSSPANTPSPCSPYSPASPQSESTPPVTPPLPTSKHYVPPQINTNLYYQPSTPSGSVYNIPQSSPLFSVPSFSPNSTALPSPFYTQNDFYNLPFSPAYGLAPNAPFDTNSYISIINNPALQNFMNASSSIPGNPTNNSNITYDSNNDFEYLTNNTNNFAASTMGHNMQDFNQQ